ncbi:MAG TPA: hypothetical protein PLV83_05910 [Bacilli bacterium]|nr:hypothetical protein [Bacilli bacterium]
MRVELKVYVPARLKNRIRMIAEEKGISMNKLVNLLIEDGLYKMFEEEVEYGEIKSEQINS